MSIIILKNGVNSSVRPRKVELVKINGKYFIELDEFEQSDSLAELSISLASEIDMLRERLEVLEEKIKILEQKSDI